MGRNKDLGMGYQDPGEGVELTHSFLLPGRWVLKTSTTSRHQPHQEMAHPKSARLLTAVQVGTTEIQEEVQLAHVPFQGRQSFQLVTAGLQPEHHPMPFCPDLGPCLCKQSSRARCRPLPRGP